jgi:hypothetical protein
MPNYSPKGISKLCDTYRWHINTEDLEMGGEMLVPRDTPIDKVQTNAMCLFSKIAYEHKVSFDPFNATIYIHKIKCSTST